MPSHTFHFLNVKDGDCSIIEHGSGHKSVIDVCNARKAENRKRISLAEYMYLEESAKQLFEATGALKNYGQKKNPENPIEYLQKFNVDSIFRFALTHPDMDHMDGIEDLFEAFDPANFYDSDNNKEMEDDWSQSPYREEDWLFYKNLMDNKPDTQPKRIVLFSGDNGIHRRKDWDGNPPGDAFYTLAPTPELVEQANENKEDYHAASYVFMYWSAAGRIILSGDSHNDTWDHILSKHEKLVKDVELLIAPHHGRKSRRSYEFLDVVNPMMTFFGNALAKHLAYQAWRNRKLEFLTNNQAGSMIVDCRKPHLSIYVTNEQFARDKNPETYYSDTYNLLSAQTKDEFFRF